MTVLIVDDEEPIRELISYNVAREGFSFAEAANGQEALRLAKSIRPNVIILDLMLPDMNGLDVCRALKSDAETADIPVIMESAKTDDSDIVAGLELGADDYITKPFSPKVLIARIRSVLRRSSARKTEPSVPEEIRIRDIRIIPRKHEVFIRNAAVELSAAEFSILLFLAEHPGQVFSAEQIYENVWQESASYTVENTVMVHIRHIREKVEIDTKKPRYVKVVWGIGYKMEKYS